MAALLQKLGRWAMLAYELAVLKGRCVRRERERTQP